MFILDTKTNQKVEAVIERVTLEDFKRIKNDKRFIEFDWDKERLNEVYKLRLVSSNQVLGLVSLIDQPREFWIKINLLQVSKENEGQNKRYDYIAGCLLAHTCNKSFIMKYKGMVGLEPKRKQEVIGIYTQKYGMKWFGIHLYTAGENSKWLIKKYLNKIV